MVEAHPFQNPQTGGVRVLVVEDFSNHFRSRIKF